MPKSEILISKELALQAGLSRMSPNLPNVITKVKYLIYHMQHFNILFYMFLSVFARFDEVLESPKAVLAAVRLPNFIVMWLKEEESRDSLKTLDTTGCRSLPHHTQNDDLYVPPTRLFHS